jgi:riboflavin kinase/FMN adenylyltransferase
MKVVSHLSEAAAPASCVLTIGNFDGIHLGHQQILRTVIDRARKLRLTPAVLTFDPHPMRVLSPAQAPKLIHTLGQKLRLLESMGIELVFTARFDAAFAALTPEEFVQQYLLEGLHAKVICIGSNFTFGNRQTGNRETLMRWRNEFDVVEIPAVSARRVIASSTLVRQRVQDGHVSRACRLLGRWFEIEGSIVTGAGRGRNITVPTLNLEPENELVPRDGVYISRIALDSGNFLDSITNIGTRPTFDGTSQTIETFVLNAGVPSTTNTARLQFLKRVRDERKFDSPDLLRQQILRDVETATRFFRMLQAGADARIHSN